MPILRPRGRKNSEDDGPVKFLDLAEYKFFEEDETETSHMA